jgi:hypothetical protein
MNENLNIFESNRREMEVNEPIFVLDDNEIGYQKLSSQKPLIFEGIRGSGKTSLFKTLDWEVAWGLSQYKLFPEKNIKKNVENPKFIGLYVDLEAMELEIWNDWLSKDNEKKKAQYVFSTYLELIFLDQLLSAIYDLRIKKDKFNSKDNEEKFVEEVFNQVFLIKTQESNIREKSLFFLKQKVNITHQNIRNAISFNIGFNEIQKGIHISVSFSEFIKSAGKSMRSYFKNFENFILYILIDDFHRFKPWQQEVINSWIIKKDIYLTYKLSILSGLKEITRKSTENRFLGHNDLEKVVFSESNVSEGKVRSEARSEKSIKKKRFNKIVNGIIKTRLKHFYEQELENFDFKKFLNVDKTINEKVYYYLKKMESPEIIKLLKEYELLKNKNIGILNFWLKKNEVRDYEEAYSQLTEAKKKRKISSQYLNKFQLFAAFQLCESYPYGGFDEIYQISNLSIRNFLYIIDSIFRKIEIKDSLEFLKKDKIPLEIQSWAIRRLANNHLKSLDTSKYSINKTEEDICIRLGKLIKSFNSFEYVKMSSPECSSIRIERIDPADEIGEILDNMVESGSIIRKIGKKHDRYSLNTIFYPHFNLTYRSPFTYSRSLSLDSFKKILLCEDKDISREIKYLLNEINIEEQQKLF